MGDEFASNDVTDAQVVEIILHSLRVEPVMQLACSHLDFDDFCDGREAIQKLVFAAGTQLFQQTKALPTRETMILECEQRCLRDPLCDLEYQQRVSTFIEECYRERTLNSEYAITLIRQFIWERRVHFQIVDMAEKRWSTPEQVEELYKNASLTRINSAAAIDTTSLSAKSLLALPETFKPVRFVKTGYRKLDGALGGGLAVGEMSALIGPTGVGKSSWVANLALNLSEAGNPALIVSLEMTSLDLLRLAVCIKGRIPRMVLRSGIEKPDHMNSCVNASKAISETPLYLCDRFSFPGITMDSGPPDMEAVGAVIEQFVSRHGVRVVFLDYLAKIGPFDDEELRRMTMLNDWAFSLSRKQNIHIVALGQQNKASFLNKDKRSGKRGVDLHDARGGIECVADPDNVIFLVRDDWNTESPQSTSEMRIVVQKARQGPGGFATVKFHRRFGLIEEKMEEDRPPQPEKTVRYESAARSVNAEET